MTAKADLLEIYAQAFRDNFDLPALNDYGENKVTSYYQLAERIAQIHCIFEKAGLKQGDKVALIGKNSARWVTIFFATITYGAVIVPILPDFNPQDAQHIVNHSEAVFLFVQKSTWEAMDLDEMPMVKAVMAVEHRKVLAVRPGGPDMERLIRGVPHYMRKRYPEGFRLQDIKYPVLPPDTTILINYTSGTTGFSKGVMLTLDNLLGNVEYGIGLEIYKPGYRCLSFLPLSHAYGCAFDMLVPLACGAHVTLFNKIPSPNLLMKALAEVRPNLVVCVPLILEKIYRKQIVPMISKPPLRWVLALPMLDKAVYIQIRKKLIDAFGGNFSQVIIGGAPLNGEVEDFLYKIKFPFSVGYGMTECGPLISFSEKKDFILKSCGKVLPNMEAKIISERPGEPGEIVVRGQNVMKGYYKNPEDTERVLEEYGWLHTGDMGTLSEDNVLFIKGRYKTMILSASGQNIYPEEIEAKLNNMPFVSESLVIDRDGKLIALVYPDYEALDTAGISDDRLPFIMDATKNELNKLVAPYERISEIKLMATEFEKTPKKSIKRFLYNN